MGPTTIRADVCTLEADFYARKAPKGRGMSPKITLQPVGKNGLCYKIQLHLQMSRTSRKKLRKIYWAKGPTKRRLGSMFVAPTLARMVQPLISAAKCFSRLIFQ